MKTKILMVAVIIALEYSSYGQSCEWVRTIGCSDKMYGRALMGINGSIFCFGNFSGSCYFQSDTLLSNGANDMFIAKYNADGNELWAKKMGGNNSPDPEWDETCWMQSYNNKYYISGRVYGALSILQCTGTGYGGYDGFVTCLDSSGNCLWSKNIGSPLNNDICEVDIDPTGNIIMIGECASNCPLDTFNLMGTYLAKLDSNGNAFWMKDNLLDGCYYSSIKVTNNAIYINAITTQNNVRIDTISFNSVSTRSVLAKFNLQGDVLWVKKYDTKGFNFPMVIEVDNKGNIYNAGSFSDTLVYDSATIGNPGQGDIFIVKLDSNGSLLWIEQCHADGVMGAIIYDLKLSSDNNIFITGDFGGNASFGNYNISNTVGYADAFIAEYDTNGICLGVFHFGPAFGLSVDIDNDGSILNVGIFGLSPQLCGTVLNSVSTSDMYILKLNDINYLPPPKNLETNTLIIYANPNTGKCNIIVPDDFLYENKLVLCIYNNKGQLIQKKDMLMEGEKIFLDLEAEAKGMYTATLTNGKKMYSGKIIFE